MYGAARGIRDDLPGGYLLDALFSVGPSRFEGGAELPISWQELAAYAAATGELTEPWELRAVMRMSRAYTTERAQGDDPLRIPPVERGQIE
jgi:hypothetical protein